MRHLILISFILLLMSCSQQVEVVSTNNIKPVDPRYIGMSYNEMMMCKEIDSWSPEKKELFKRIFVYTEKDIKELDSLLRK